MSERIFSKSRVKEDPLEMDSVAWSKKFEGRRAFEVLMDAQRCWDNMGKFREERERNRRYAYGDQWGDYVTVEGKTMTEEEYIKSQGNVPLKTNLIRRLMKNVLGVYRSQSKEPTCVARDRDEQKLGETMSTVLQYNMQLNRMQGMYARSMEEFLISGFIVHHKWYGWKRNKLDCWTEAVHPNCFFIDNNMRDFRGWDVSLLGEVHDVGFGDLCEMFAESPEDYRRLRDIYRASHNQHLLRLNCEQFGYSRLENYDFLFTSQPDRCRVIEVWRKENKPRWRCHDYNTGEIYKIEIGDKAELVDAVNAERVAKGVAAGMAEDDIPLIEAEWFMDSYWYYYYLTPFGDILKEGETPYAHKGHPYAFIMYPFIDGEIHSFVADVIDQQRYTNRLYTMYDWIMRASSKGVLLVPEESIGSMDIEEIADEWSRFNGVIAIKTKNGVPMPQQVANNATNIGITELLQLQLKMFEDISGVNGALQGKPGYAGTSGTLYAQQTQNATMSLLDLLDTFSDFVRDAAYIDVKNIQQYYDDERYYQIAGEYGRPIDDPERIRDVEWDISIVESTSTPAYRQTMNDYLLQFWQAGQLSLVQLLEHGDFPFADALIQDLQSQQEQMAQGQVPQGVNPELLQQAQQGADMNAVEQAYQAMRG